MDLHVLAWVLFLELCVFTVHVCRPSTTPARPVGPAPAQAAGRVRSVAARVASSRA